MLESGSWGHNVLQTPALVSRTKDALWLNLCVNYQGREIAKYDDRTLTFDLFTARSSLLPYGFVWEKMLRISNDLLWSLWASVAQISLGASLGQGNER